jgi:hypothetical protein
LVSQLAVRGATVQRLLKRRNFVDANMAGVVLAVLPMLQLVIRPGIGGTILEGMGG